MVVRVGHVGCVARRVCSDRHHLRHRAAGAGHALAPRGRASTGAGSRGGCSIRPEARTRGRRFCEVVAVTAVLASSTAFVLLLTITAYSVAGGVDYGAGIWDLLAGRGSRADRARELIDHAMAPVWEANNVWLVLATVVCWTGFPLLFHSVFSSLSPGFAVPLPALLSRGPLLTL